MQMYTYYISLYAVDIRQIHDILGFGSRDNSVFMELLFDAEPCFWVTQSTPNRKRDSAKVLLKQRPPHILHYMNNPG